MNKFTHCSFVAILISITSHSGPISHLRLRRKKYGTSTLSRTHIWWFRKCVFNGCCGRYHFSFRKRMYQWTSRRKIQNGFNNNETTSSNTWRFVNNYRNSNCVRCFCSLGWYFQHSWLFTPSYSKKRRDVKFCNCWCSNRWSYFISWRLESNFKRSISWWRVSSIDRKYTTIFCSIINFYLGAGILVNKVAEKAYKAQAAIPPPPKTLPPHDSLATIRDTEFDLIPTSWTLLNF